MMRDRVATLAHDSILIHSYPAVKLYIMRGLDSFEVARPSGDSSPGSQLSQDGS